MDPEKIQLLDEKGREHLISRDKVNFIVIHNTFENPISQVNVTPSLQNKLKKVYVGTTKKPVFSGWPIKFIDDLVIFFDTKGKTHVIQLNKILRLRPVLELSKKRLSLKSQSPALSYGDAIGACQKEIKDSKRGIIPTRILGDKIQISEFLNNFEKGYEKVNSYQERTYLYAKPFLFPEQTKLGVTLYDSAFANPLNVGSQMPAYFQWSSGRPYRFQSFNQIGYVTVPYLPTIEPLVVARSEVKSHFFRGSFVGNLNALPAGTEYYTGFEREDGNVFKPTVTRAGVAINYMALMGADYENWSLGVGTSYNTFYVQVETYFREILGSALTPLLRLMYTEKKWTAYGIIGQTDLGSDNPDDLHISSSSTTSIVGVINSFNLESVFVRGGIDFEIFDQTFFGANFLFLDAKFSESLAIGDSNFFNWNSKNFQVHLHKQFGEYVSLRVFGHSFNFDYDSEVSSQPKAGTFNEFLFGGQFEFVF